MSEPYDWAKEGEVAAHRIFRVYEPWECGKDGYPRIWHGGLTEEVGEQLVGLGVKHLVRAQAEHRCVRCGHPYQQGDTLWSEVPVADLALADRLLEGGEQVEPPKRLKRIQWSPCDEHCSHVGPLRVDGDAMAMPVGVLGDGQPESAGEWVRTAGVERVEAAWRILTVHHLNGIKRDLRWWNLVALCQRCHLTIQRKVVMERVWPLEHSEWFQPYAAGWYAYIYEGRELTREQTLAEVDRLLGLERLA